MFWRKKRDPPSARSKPFYNPAESHLFSRLGKNILFNVETMLFYEVSPVVFDLATHLSNSPEQDPVRSLRRRYKKGDINQAISYLTDEGILKKGEADGKAMRPPLKKRRGIKHLELMVTNDCNMGCRYCYGCFGEEGWEKARYLYGGVEDNMSFETAQRGVDFLFRESGNQKDLSIIFFGGEPLMAFGLIKQIVPYIREKEKETGKRADLSLSTNGLLLTGKVVDFLVKNRIGCQVSIDGTKEIQDRNRCLKNGKGSYERVLPGIERLIAARRGKVPARVTVAHDAVKLPKIVDHLLSLGFGSVHIEPAIGSSGEMAVTAEDIEQIKQQNESLAVALVNNVRRDQHFDYSNLVRFVRQTRIIQERMAHYCGAGRTYFALSQDGCLYPCHRFVGMEEYRIGDPDKGIDQNFQNEIVNLTVDQRPACRDCWARYLCGGGCWKHAVDINGRLDSPDVDLSCELIKHQIECAMAINSELKVSDKEILHEKEETPLYFAFPDGVLHYDCDECTAVCCKGHGFGGSLQEELRPLFVLYPQIESMAVQRQGDYIGFVTPSSGCLLLDGDNRCRIEKEQGEAAKPSICKLFPFTRLMQIGDAIAVRPHFLCPLRFQVPARPGLAGVTHSALESSIRSSPIINHEFMSSRRPPFGLHSSTNAESVLARETTFRDSCASALGRSRFAEVLRSASEDPGALDGFIARAALVLGLPVPSQPRRRDSVDDLLLALAPPLRLEMLHLSSEAILRGLSVGELILRRAASLSSIPLTLSGANTLLSKFEPMLRLLGRGDEPLDMPHIAHLKSPQFGDPGMLAAFIAIREAGEAGGLLGALEKAIRPTLTVSDRSVLLNEIGSRVEDAMRSARPSARAIIGGNVREAVPAYVAPGNGG